MRGTDPCIKMGWKNMAQMTVEEMKEKQQNRLRAFRLLRGNNPEQARREAFARLVEAGLIDEDGKPKKPYI